MKKVISILLAFVILCVPSMAFAEEAEVVLAAELQSESIEAGDQFLANIVKKSDGKTPFLTFRINGTFDNDVATIIAPVYSNENLGILTNRFDNENGTFTFEGYDQTLRGTNEEVVCSILFKAEKGGDFNIDLADDCLLGKAKENAFYVIEIKDADTQITADTDNEEVKIIEDPEPQTPYDELIIGHWAEKEIVVMYKLGALEGIADETIDTERAITRGEFATMLQKICKLKATGAVEAFNDVDKESFMYTPINILKTKKIAEGDGNGNFMPEEPILWQDAFTLMFRTMKTMNKVDPEIDVDKYIALSEERETISSYALEPWAGMLRAKILNPGENANITVASPGLPMTLAQASYFLNKLAEFNILVSRG